MSFQVEENPPILTREEYSVTLYRVLSKAAGRQKDIDTLVRHDERLRRQITHLERQLQIERDDGA